MRGDVWKVATNAQAEVHFASDTLGMETAVTEKKRKKTWMHSLSAVRRFRFHVNPVHNPKQAEQLRASDISTQITSIKADSELVMVDLAFWDE